MSTIEVTIPLRSHDEAIQVLGPYDRYAKLLRQSFDVDIHTKGGNLRLRGETDEVDGARKRIEHMLGKLRKGRSLDPMEIERILVEPREGAPAGPAAGGDAPRGAPARTGTLGSHGRSSEERRASASLRSDAAAGFRLRSVEPRGVSQRRYLEAIQENTITFGVGPAGTGKTFLAVAAAVRTLRSGECRRLVITRPVVEAGENLGFLPGDLQAKLNPYMRPVYDALFALVGFEETRELEDAGVIEIAPLAYMRGRTLADAFVILDEGQNTTIAQMKMFLTRLGERSRMVATGDPSQSDLPPRQTNGLIDAVRRLRGHQGIAACEFSERDIVRHPLVQSIVRAYEGSGGAGAPGGAAAEG